jgi:hypothetical protein
VLKALFFSCVQYLADGWFADNCSDEYWGNIAAGRKACAVWALWLQVPITAVREMSLWLQVCFMAAREM